MMEHRLRKRESVYDSGVQCPASGSEVEWLWGVSNIDYAENVY